MRCSPIVPLAALWVFLLTAGWHAIAWSVHAAEHEREHLSLQKSVGQRDYNGKNVPGEERQIAPGDSLWRILIQERRLSSRKFSHYVTAIRGLNPQLGPDGTLLAGDHLFVPFDLDELVSAAGDPAPRAASSGSPTAAAQTEDYLVRPGDNLNVILRERLGVRDARARAAYFASVRDLNPHKRNWNFLAVGETIRLPVPSRAATSGSAVTAREGGVPIQAPAAPYPKKSAAETAAWEQPALVVRVIEAFGIEVQRNGEEVFTLRDETVRLERHSFPLLYNRMLDQKVLLDAEGKIPAVVRRKLAAAPNVTPVFSLTHGITVREAVSELLARLGFQPLGTAQPLVIREGGLSFEAKGDWMALAPEQSNRPQEVFIVNIAEDGDAMPEYLRAQLSASGLHIKEVSVSSSKGALATAVPSGNPMRPPATWPDDKAQMVDTMLSTYGVVFNVSETLRITNEGGGIEIVADRGFDLRSRRTVIFFRRLPSEWKQLLHEKLRVNVVELDLAALTARELIARLSAELGEQAGYREHRFNAAAGAKSDKVMIAAQGFLLAQPGVFVTDNVIPPGYHRFFFERGLAIVYFR